MELFLGLVQLKLHCRGDSKFNIRKIIVHQDHLMLFRVKIGACCVAHFWN